MLSVLLEHFYKRDLLCNIFFHKAKCHKFSKFLRLSTSDLPEKGSKGLLRFEKSWRAKRHLILGSMLLGVERAYLTLSARNHRENTKEKANSGIIIMFKSNVRKNFKKSIRTSINPYPTAFPYGNGMVLHFYQQQESSTTKTVHKVINKGLKTYV